jgi:hypothetical protein
MQKNFFIILIFVSIQTPLSTNDDEQKLVYKRILRGGDIPSAGLQKLSINNRCRHMVFFYVNKNTGDSCIKKRKNDET